MGRGRPSANLSLPALALSPPLCYLVLRRRGGPGIRSIPCPGWQAPRVGCGGPVGAGLSGRRATPPPFPLRGKLRSREMAIDLEALALLGSARGGQRPRIPLELVVMRELGEEDLPALVERPKVGSVTAPITRIRETHHHIARLLADGRKAVEVAAITGFSQSRISILQNDPSFKELLAYYREQVRAAHANVHERLARVGTVALEIVEERLLDSPETFSHKELLAVAETALDRSVAPPKGRDQPVAGPAAGPVQVQINFVPHQAPLEAPRSGGGGPEDHLLIEIQDD